MATRRDFLKAASLAGGAVILDRRNLWGGSLGATNFGLNDFIESHPDAVFILRTNVDVKTNGDAIRAVGHQLGGTLFVSRPAPTHAYAADGKVVIKPNITQWTLDIPPINIEQTMGIQTDPNFVEGMIHSLADVGVQNSNVYLREANYVGDRVDGHWYRDMALRAGVDLHEFPNLPELQDSDIQWMDVPNGVWYRRIPFLQPVNSPGSCLINIAKFKSHAMGITLSSKNVQGTNARPYVHYCTRLSVDYGVNPDDIVPDARQTIRDNYQRHLNAGIPRWDVPGESGGLWQETHASRCLDNISILHPLIHIVEGVYSREGSHVSGPEDNGGYARDIMTNIVMFGKNFMHVDIIGTYLAGHEPGNFGLFHLALERGLSHHLNPRSIPLYEWHADGTATATTLENFPRTPIRTPYLRRAGEEQYHLVNEPYNYSETGVRTSTKYEHPDVFVLSQNFPNPFNPGTSIQYYIPESGHVRLEIFDVQGQRIDLLVDALIPAGDHMQVWDSTRRASGTYFYRLSFGGMQKTRSMVLVK